MVFFCYPYINRLSTFSRSQTKLTMSKCGHNMLELLSDELLFVLFRGLVLTGRATSKKLRDRLRNAGSANAPNYIRIASSVPRLYAQNLTAELSFLKSFKCTNILMSCKKHSKVARALRKVLKNDFGLTTIQEITESDVHRAARQGGSALLELTDQLVTQAHPLPKVSVLVVFLWEARRGILRSGENNFIEASKQLILLFLRQPMITDIIAEEIFKILDIFVDIEDHYDASIVKELVDLLHSGTEKQREHAMSAIWIFARSEEKVFSALGTSSAIHQLVAIARAGKEFLMDYALGALMNLAEGMDEMKSLLQAAGIIDLFVFEAENGTEIRKEYALEGLMHLTEGNSTMLEAIQKSGVVEVLIYSVELGTEMQMDYAVEALMNLAAGSEAMKQVLYDKGAIYSIVRAGKLGLRCAVEAICNFAATGSVHIHRSLLLEGGVDLLFSVIRSDCCKFNEREDILWAMENLAGSSNEIKKELRSKGLVELLAPFTRSESDVEREYAMGALINLMANDITVKTEVLFPQ
jgi:hypothetical protein